jgi:hypothetical protein
LAAAIAVWRFAWPDLPATAVIVGLGLLMSGVFGLAAPLSRLALIDMARTLSGTASRLSAQPEA